MTIIIHPDPVPLRTDEQGNVYVGDSRVLLETIIGHFQQGHAAEDIAEAFDTVSRADVYAVLAYYLRHQDELDEYIEQREQKCAEQHRQVEASQQPFLAEMKERRAAWDAGRQARDAQPAEGK